MEFLRCAAAPVFSGHVLAFYAPRLQLACMKNVNHNTQLRCDVNAHEQQNKSAELA